MDLRPPHSPDRRQRLEPGDLIFSGWRKGAVGGIKRFVADLSSGVQSTPYTHVAMYSGKRKLLEGAVEGGEFRVTEKPLPTFYNRIVRVGRPELPPGDRIRAVQRLRARVGWARPEADFYWDAAATTFKRHGNSRVGKNNAICSNLVAAAYGGKVGRGRSIAYVRPVDLLKDPQVSRVFAPRQAIELAKTADDTSLVRVRRRFAQISQVLREQGRVGKPVYARSKVASTIRQYLRRRDGKLVVVEQHERRNAPGIPDRDRFVPIPTGGGDWVLNLQRHYAKRAKEHVDLRLVAGEHAHSWALPTAKLPPPGGVALAVQQPTHEASYAGWSGEIPSGYGAGKVVSEHLGLVHVAESGPDKITFVQYEGKSAHEFSLIRTGEKAWLLVNHSTTPGKYVFPQDKPRYATTAFADGLADTPEDTVMQPKVDGALALLVAEPGKRPRVFGWRTPKKGGVIEYTHKIPGLYETRVPKGVRGVFRGEIFLHDGDSVLPAERTAGVLNSDIVNARSAQAGKEKLRLLLFDRVGTGKPYEDRLRDVELMSEALPGLLMKPQIARTRAEKKELLEKVRAGTHPLTREGVVLWRDTPTKAKVVEDVDVWVRDVFPGRGKHLGRAGGFSYSRTPDGPIVGRVGTGFTDAQRGKMKDLVGAPVLVAYDREHRSGALQAARFVGVRADWQNG